MEVTRAHRRLSREPPAVALWIGQEAAGQPGTAVPVHYNAETVVELAPRAPPPPEDWMPDAREYQLVVAEAEQAARAGDYPRADVLMREALRLQESTLGSLHPDLASTLNNLAVVCEAIGHIDDAEQFYRRACAVASWSRPPTDPLVITSRENLKDFCASQGRPLDEWPDIARVEAAAPVAQAPRSHAAVASPHMHASPASLVSPASPVSPAARPAAARASTAPPVGRGARTSAVPAASSSASRTSAAPPTSVNRSAWMTPVVGAVALVAIIGAVVLVRSWRATPQVERAAEVQPEAPAITPPPATGAPESLSPAPASPAATPGDAASGPTAVLTPPGSSVASPARPDPPAAATSAPSPPASTTAAPVGVRIVVAEVCASLSTSGAWRCDPLDTPASAGRAVFYTRIASPSGMRVEHRWYQGPTLRQTVPLSIAANPSAGYRTFSRQTLTAGAWRVELRAADGTVLHEVAFEVR